MQTKKNKTDITIFLPTFNADVYLDEILKAINKQKIDKTFEVLIIDSGSTDKTLEIIKKHPKVRLHKIPNSEFGHGRTRQLAAEMAKGEIIVYLSHDATPAHDRWLYEMIKPFELNDRVVAVMGKQIPRPHCFPLMKYEISSVFRKLGPDSGISLFYKDSFMNDRAMFEEARFYSDVNSAARVKYLLSKVPYRDVPYAEDQLFGEDVLNAGFIKAYSPRGSVLHSNDIGLGDYGRRIFDETFGHKRNGVKIVVPPLSNHMLQLTKAITRDTIRIMLDTAYGMRQKLFWIMINPLFHIQRARGYRQAAHARVDDPLHSKKSLESKKRSKS